MSPLAAGGASAATVAAPLAPAAQVRLPDAFVGQGLLTTPASSAIGATPPVALRAAAAPAPSGPSTKSHMDGMDMALVPGAASQSPEATAMYARARALLAKYPTEASLRAAGFGIEPNGNHYRLWERSETFSGGGASAAQILVKGGRTIGIQFDTKASGAEPPAWAGVQWHRHGTQPWMTHVYTDLPLDGGAYTAETMA